MSSSSIAERMMSLFAGHPGVQGTHGLPTQKPDSLKWEIKSTASTIREPVTVESWEKHLAGQRPLGVVPIREDGTCMWGSIDIDEYEEDMLSVVQRAEAAKLPLVPCRSKSGGLHLFLFMGEPADAAVLQGILKDIAAQLGYANSEIFPKQTRVLSERGDLGNWMVMPYFGDTYGGKLREQVGIKKTGAEMTVEEFLRAGWKARLTVEQLQELAVARGSSRRRRNGQSTGPFSDGPPCLQHLAAQKVKIGGQNNALFHMGVYYRRSVPGAWKEALEQANRDFLDPPGSSEGVAGVIRSLEKKDYEYTCKNEPMCSHCDSALCRTRKYGIGADGNWPTIGSISKLDTQPPIWFVDVDGHRLELNTDQLQNYNKFHAACMEQANLAFLPMKAADWYHTLNQAMQSLTLIKAPKDLSMDEQIRERLEEFLTNRSRGERREDLLSGRPWEDVEEGRHYFRLRDLVKHLEREGVKNIGRNHLGQILRRLGGEDHFFNISGKGVGVWWVPSSVVTANPEIPIPTMRGEKI